MNIQQIRDQFPALQQQISGHPLIYFDNAAMAPMPERVMKRVLEWEGRERGNIHSGLHSLSQRAAEAYEAARQTVADFIGADEDEIVFVKNTTEAINLVAYSWARRNLQRGDTIVISELEHHSNILPWKILCDDLDCELRWLPIDEHGCLPRVIPSEVPRSGTESRDLLDNRCTFVIATPPFAKGGGGDPVADRVGDLDEIFDRKVKLLALCHISNAIGTINPVKEIIAVAKKKGIVTVIDGAQAVPHMKVDVKDIGCDFYAFSGYKLYGPTGIGVLYARREILKQMSPFLAGGGTILSVRKNEVRWREAPEKLEGGTPNLSGAVALGEATRWLSEIGLDKIVEHERALTAYALEQLSGLPEVVVYGPRDINERGSVISFNVIKSPSPYKGEGGARVWQGAHPHDVAALLDEKNIAIRAGHHCAGPLMEVLGVLATCRVSFGAYNTREEVDIFIKALKEVIRRFI